MTEQHLVEYNVTDAMIAEMEGLYMGLVITALDNREEVAAVHAARIVVKGKRVEVEKRRKELKADALAWGRKVDTEAKRIFGKLAPTESHLKAEENKVIEERNRIKAEQDRLERERIQGVVDAFAKYGKNVPFHDVATLTGAEVAEQVAVARAEYEKEQERLAAEKKVREEEDKRLAAERKKLEKARKEQEEKERVLREEQERLRKEQEALEATKREEQERKEREEFERQAKIQAEKEAKEEAERKERERLEQEEAEAAEKARQEALKPDKEKVVTWVKGLLCITAPKVKDEELREVLYDALSNIRYIGNNVLEKIGRV